MDLLQYRYGLGRAHGACRLGGGLTNKTYRVESSRGTFVVQCLHQQIVPRVIENMCNVCEFMEGKGWVVPRLLPTPDGAPCFADASGRTWRIYRYIPGVAGDNRLTAAQLRRVGKILAQYHRDLSGVSVLKPGLEGFHCPAWYLAHLDARRERITEGPAVGYLQAIRDGLKQACQYGRGPYQTIHGDARIGNLLLDAEGTPFTLIDYDTMMRGSVFLDLGDMIRSVCCSHDNTEIAVDEESIGALIQGYREEDRRFASDYVRTTGITYAVHLSIELAARFLIDSVDQSYFQWDCSRYGSLAAHNQARARQQYNLSRELERLLTTNRKGNLP